VASPPRRDTTTPSGLAKINAWVEDATNNTATRFYGGDLLGNVWRFDYDGLVEPKNSAFKLGTLHGVRNPAAHHHQAMLLQAGGKPVVIVGTGRYLGEGDITDATQQSIYAIKDPLINSGWGTIRTNVSFVKQTLTVNTAAKTATVTKNAVDWSTNAGWWVDLPTKRSVSAPPWGCN
jgi:type IV pilus assembly protein PilY1